MAKKKIKLSGHWFGREMSPPMNPKYYSPFMNLYPEIGLLHITGMDAISDAAGEEFEDVTYEWDNILDKCECGHCV